jgi:hypothetical protein
VPVAGGHRIQADRTLAKRRSIATAPREPRLVTSARTTRCVVADAALADGPTDSTPGTGDMTFYRGDNQDPAFIAKIRKLSSQQQDWPRHILNDDGYFRVI